MSNDLTPEEIAALLNITSDEEAIADGTHIINDDEAEAEQIDVSDGDIYAPPQAGLTADESDAIGEIGNISMGTSATTLYTLLNRRVNITTPKVSLIRASDLVKNTNVPFVVVEVQYTAGLVGNNVLLLREDDVKIITDLLMGGDGTNIEDDLSELHLSAISEVMNQMVASSAISMASILQVAIDISPPVCHLVSTLSGVDADFLKGDELIVSTSFDMEVEGLIKSDIRQLMPLEFARTLIAGLLSGEGAGASKVDDDVATNVYDSTAHVQGSATEAYAFDEPAPAAPAPQPAPQPVPQPAAYQQPQPVPQPVPQPIPQPVPQPAAEMQPQYQPAPQPAPQYAPPAAEMQPQFAPPPPQDPYGQYNPYNQQGQYPQYGQQGQYPNMAYSQNPPYPPYPPYPQQPQYQQSQPQAQIGITPVHYQTFDAPGQGSLDFPTNIDLVMDVPLQITIELGRTKKSIREILDMNLGSVIVLDKLAGEPVEIYINGKLIARSEVVVIDENYGVRVTEVISAPKSLIEK